MNTPPPKLKEKIVDSSKIEEVIIDESLINQEERLKKANLYENPLVQKNFKYLLSKLNIGPYQSPTEQQRPKKIENLNSLSKTLKKSNSRRDFKELKKIKSRARIFKSTSPHAVSNAMNNIEKNQLTRTLHGKNI